ncbi:DUF2868 domain-containing protein [Halochromatium roseum]|uniref:DUF2868 domain-containing protein n=1 Tax=Halochromatium roseum TaxID=391920 RepID=UPI001914B5DC|nr:DUF2868 domain-containing protein [Halochromatium roseum]MBK5941579.1 hypothetical protein [Halochromatium roseum]
MLSLLRRLAPNRHSARDGKSGHLRWQVPDLIDFDYYVDEDERLLREHPAERRHLAERDRAIYKDRIEPFIGDADAHTRQHRNQALRWWLERRRDQEEPEIAELLPGQAFARAQRLVATAMGLVGLAIGIGAASTLLHYEGDHPVNVSWYLFWLVLFQLILVGTTFGLWYGRRSKLIKGATQDISFLGQVLRPLFSRAARWVQKQRLTHVRPDLQERAKAKRGLLQANYALYGPASYLPVLVPAQVFGIGFNIGVIFMTMALIWFADLGFGWGSAMNIRAETIQGLIRFIALPWSWLLGEGVGLPTLDQIAGTRISLKDPLYVLDAGHLRSWRWFLVLSVLTYGLLPRIALLGLSALKQRRALAALPFTHQSAQAPYARMITPSLETKIIRNGEGPEMPIPAPLKPLSKPTAAPRPAKTDARVEPRSEPRSEPKSEPSDEPHTTTASAPSAATQTRSETTAAAPSHPPSAPEPQQTPPAPPSAASKPKPEPKPEPKSTPKPESRPEPLPLPGPAETSTGPSTQPPSAHAALERTSATPESEAPPVDRVTVDADACVLLLHIDVADLLAEQDHARLQQLLRSQTGWRVAAAVTYGGGRAMADQTVELISNAIWHAPPPRIALIQDGSQPPITENLRFLRSVRAAAGEQAQVLLALIGDPDDDEDDPLPPLSDFDFADWQRKIEQMGDPYLRLVMLAPPDDDEAE